MTRARASLADINRAAKAAVAIDFACNNPDNGNFAGRACMAAFLDCEIMHDNWLRGCVFHDKGGRVRIHRKEFAYFESREWFGNWCWNRYWFRPVIAKQLIRHMRGVGCWSMDAGPSKLFDWWEGDRP